MNILKVYKDRIENAPFYEEYYTYFLYERFVKEYLARVIDEALITYKEIDIRVQDVEKYFLDVIKEDIMAAVSDRLVAIKNGTLKLDSVRPNSIEKLALDAYKIAFSENAAETEENSETKEERINKIVDDYAKTYTYYVPKAMSLVQALPFNLKDGHLISPLKKTIDFYLAEMQADYALEPETDKMAELKRRTRAIFGRKVISELIPSLIEFCKSNNVNEVIVPYTISEGVAKFRDVEFLDAVRFDKNPEAVDLYELGRCISMIPGEDVTNYEYKDNLTNHYKFKYTLQNLEEFYNSILEELTNKKQSR